jgi:hypothetical protein
MAGIGHRHRLLVLVASPGASLSTARRGASSWTGAWALGRLAARSNCDIRVSMGRQSGTLPKKRGPPATGKGEPILVRLQPAQLAALDAWMARQHSQLSRPEAIRRLLEQALAVAQPVKSRTQKARSKAHGLASTQLDRLLDPSAPDEERQRRKRRLLKGPKEFREMRDAVHSKSKR